MIFTLNSVQFGFFSASNNLTEFGVNRNLIYFPRYLLNSLSLFRCAPLWLEAIWSQQRSPRARHVTSPSSVWRWESPPSCSAPYSPLWSSSPLSTTMTTGSPREPSTGRASPSWPFQSVFCFSVTQHSSDAQATASSPKYTFAAICYKIVWRYDKSEREEHTAHLPRRNTHLNTPKTKACARSVVRNIESGQVCYHLLLKFAKKSDYKNSILVELCFLMFKTFHLLFVPFICLER